MYFKKFHGEECEADFFRVNALHSASQQTDHFRAPGPVSICPEEGTIDYEWLPEGATLHDLINSGAYILRHSEVEEIMASVGRALGAFHNLAKPINTEEFSILDDLDKHILGKDRQEIEDHIRASKIAPLHGDFSRVNVWVSKNGHTLHLIDPIPRQYEHSADKGVTSIYFDIAFFCLSVILLDNLKVGPLHTLTRRLSLVDRFIAGYEEVTSLNLNPKVTMLIAYNIGHRYVHEIRLKRPFTDLATTCMTLVLRIRLRKFKHRMSKIIDKL